jgi:hypothetical protein
MRQFRTGDVIAANSLSTGNQVGWWNAGSTSLVAWYDDNFNAQGAQLLPSGDNTIDTNYAVCAVVAHPELKNNLNRFSVSADINYPNVQGIGTTKHFCGSRIVEIGLLPLSIADGLKLACSSTDGVDIQHRDATLITANGYTFTDICEEIAQQQAVVFCGTSVLSYEAPAGDYSVTAIATIDGGNQVTLGNLMNYMPVDAFKTDFTTVNYGNTVTIGNLASVDGDSVMLAGDGKPTVQETGNRVLTLHVAQDDMGFDQRSVNNSLIWNVHYKTRLGSTPAWTTLASYEPSVKKGNAIIGGGYDLDNKLDLSQISKVDFGVLVDKYPFSAGTVYSGNLVITATGSLTPCGS